MAKYPFLTPEWIVEASQLREEYKDQVPPSTLPARVNLVVTEASFSDEPIHAHVETGPGLFDVGINHLDPADATVTLDYATTVAIFIEGNPQAGMQAFMTGRIKVDGDVGKLITVFGGMGSGDPLSGEIGERLRDITALSSSSG